jgi:hypothetical protein
VNIKNVWHKPALATLAALAVAGGIGACSTVQPSIGQYGIVTGHGAFSNQQVKNIVDPGQQIHVGNGDTIWYVPANVRNYVTAPSGTAADRSNPQQELTAANGKEPGMPVITWSSVIWELNPSHAVLTKFFPFCLKYGCASTKAQDTSSNESLSHSSTPGWNGMLAETFPRAIDNATRDALASFGPSLWTDQGEWGKFGDDIAAHLPAELAKMTGTTTPFFCGPGSTTSHCAPLTVLVNKVAPVDSSVVQAYNQQLSADYAAQAGQARLNAAREVYGSWANYFLGLQDTVTKCGQVKSCVIYVGAPSSPHP